MRQTPTPCQSISTGQLELLGWEGLGKFLMLPNTALKAIVEYSVEIKALSLIFFSAIKFTFGKLGKRPEYTENFVY